MSERTSIHQNNKSRPLSRHIRIDFELDPTQQAKMRVQQAREDLQIMINQLDKKIKRRLQINQSKMLYAYRNHLERVTRQLTILKEMNQKNQREFSSDKIIIHLSKQCSLFRQQAMRLHSQLQDSILDCDVYRRKAELGESEIKKCDSLIKDLIGRIKKIQVQKQKLAGQNKILRDAFANNQDSKIKIDEKSGQVQENLQSEENPQKNSKQDGKKTCQIGKGKKQMIIHIPQSSPRALMDLINNSFDSFKGLSTPKTGTNFRSKEVLTIIDGEDSRIFKNQRICKKIKPQTPNHRMNSTKNNNKRQFSGIKSHRNLVSSLDRQNVLNSQRQLFGKNQEARNQLRSYESIMVIIKKARDQLNPDISSHGLESKCVSELLSNDDDLMEIMQILFPKLDISYQKSEFGVKYKAKIKQNNKSLAHLSSQIMKKFQGKDIAVHPFTTNNKNKNPQYFSKNNNEEEEDDQQLLLLINEEGNDDQKKVKKAQIMNSSSPNLKKMNDVFKKRNFTRQQRLTTYQPQKFGNNLGKKIK